MIIMKTIARRSLAVLISVMLLVSVAVMGVTYRAENTSAQVSTPEEKTSDATIEGGLILHCWSWNFNNIKKNIPKIAEAGYAAVQTSPINACLKGDNAGMELYGDGKWYYHYQPTNYTIGNYQLGTEAEFKAMCEEAHKYGVKVIVDVVANHTSGDKDKVDPSLRFIDGGLYHNYDGSKNQDTRKSVTQWYNGLPDVNTQNPKYQKIIADYLKKVVAAGADGFRYDTAKHIELPDDDPEFASEFWPTVLPNGSEFQYGEVLQGATSVQQNISRYSDYAKIMHVTASSYGYTVRKYLDDISGRKSGAIAASAMALSNRSSENVDESRLVTWVESHDTYANGEAVFNPGVSSYWLTNEQIRRGWALITAYGNTTSLFFSRPEGSSPSQTAARHKSTIWGTNKIGNAGDENYFDPEVVAFNKFHNLMKGTSAEMTNVLRKKAFIYIKRGDKGAAFINNSPSDTMEIDVETSLPQGTYTDHVNGVTFVSKDGRLTGSLEAGKTAAVYKEDGFYTEELPTEPPTTEPVTETVATETTAPATEPPTTEPVTETVSYDLLKKHPSKVKAAKTKTVKAKTLKKKKVNLKVITLSNVKGSVKITKVKSGTAKKLYKKITVNSKTGKLTIKKGKYKKGTYKIRLMVDFKGNKEYEPKTTYVTVKVKIK